MVVYVSLTLYHFFSIRSMPQTLHITLPNSEATQRAGSSLANTLYTLPVDIFLTGELGVGKTTFVSAFASALGIASPITSPTFALEQRHTTASGRPFIHIDLYRLTEAEARLLLRQSEHHAGVRCIEWADRVGDDTITDEPRIFINLTEEEDHRRLTITFDDAPLPTDIDIATWRNEAGTPPNVVEHCEAVAQIAKRLCDALAADSVLVRPEAVVTAARLHDLLRFVDFRPEARPAHVPPASQHEERQWEHWRKLYAGLKHEEACASFLRERGFDAIAKIVEPHGLSMPPAPLHTTEQKLLLYADKRVNCTQLVSLEERFEDFALRYGDGRVSEKNRFWLEQTRRLERELFPVGPPF